MSGVTVRVLPETRDQLRELAALSGDSMQAVLSKALEAYRRQQFLGRANLAFARLRQDPETWAAEEAERADWDATLGDDLREGE